MAHTSASPFRALYRVFILPALSTLPPSNLIRRRHPAILATTTASHHPTTRQFSSTPLLSAKNRPAERRSQKWDSEITALQLILVDPLTNALSPTPSTRYDILKNLDTRTHRLVQLSPDEPGNRNFMPVCKIISKKEAYESEKKKKLAAKESKKANARGSEAGMKTLELNWAIDKGDLAHRLEKLKGFLEEGRRVEVCFRGKKRGRRASLEECEGVVGSVREAAGGIEGVREREMEGRIGGVAVLEFVARGGGGKGVSASRKDGQDGEGEEEEGKNDYRELEAR